MKQPYIAALYMRLSRDDESYGDSASIETQRVLLRQYAERERIVVYDEYVDDGFSGTNFNRPAFKRMIADIESGEVNCVITKDLSRFGREHVQMDTYLETFFPEHGVRYIAVTENEDSANGLSDFVPFKNLFNEWYAKDSSRKVRAAFKAKFENGEYAHGNVPYGYLHDKEAKKLVPNPETAPIVKQIFAWYLSGIGVPSISMKLFELSIPRPIVSKQRDKVNDPRRYTWEYATVYKILHNYTYTGDLCHYRKKKVSYKSKKTIPTQPDEWCWNYGTHEPLISHEDFDAVQQLLRSRHFSTKANNRKLFHNVYCMHCGRRLVINHSGERVYYVCNRLNDDMTNCAEKHARDDVLREFVRQDVLYWWQLLRDDEQHMLKLLKTAIKAADELPKPIVNVDELQARKARLEQVYYEMYQDKIEGTITAAMFQTMSQKYKTEMEDIEKQLSALNEETPQHGDLNIQRWIDVLKSFDNLDELTDEINTALIDKISVAVSSDKTYHIELRYKFIGVLKK